MEDDIPSPNNLESLMERTRRLLGGDGRLDPQIRERGLLDLRQILELGDAEDAVVFACCLAIAQLLEESTLDVETEGLREVVEHARRAAAVADRVPVTEQQRAKSFGVLGTALSRLGRRLPPSERPMVSAEAETALREALSRTSSDDQEKVTRAVNLATAILEAPHDSEVESARLEECESIYLNLLSRPLKPAQEFAIERHLGHVYRRSALLAGSRGEVSNAAAFFHLSMARYANAARSTDDLEELDQTTVMSVALLQSEAAHYLAQPELLDSAILLGTRALDVCATDLAFGREATMQLAGMHLARYRERWLPSDADRAQELSDAAVNSYHHEPGSDDHRSALRRRSDVLTAVALSVVGEDQHLIELDQLLRAEFAGQPPTVQMEFISGMAVIYELLEGEPFSSDEAVDVYRRITVQLDSMLRLTQHGELVDEHFVWVIRWLGLELRATDWAQLHKLRSQVWLDRLQRAGEVISQSPESWSSQPEYALSRYQLAEVARRLGLERGQSFRLREALRHYRDALAAAPPLPAPHQVQMGIDAAYLCQILGDLDDASSWIDGAMRAIEQLEPVSSAPLGARIALNRMRYRLAGEAAALGESAEEVAWRLHSVVHLPSAQDQTIRSEFLVRAGAISNTTTLIYIAESRRRCRAAIVSRGQWSLVDLPNLSIDTLAPVIAEAHQAHAAAEHGERNALTQWESARSGLETALARGLAPLSSHIGHSPVVLRLSGWLPATPILPVLVASKQFEVPMAVSLGLTRRNGAPARRFRLAAVAAPGDGYRNERLDYAVDDVEEICNLFRDADVVKYPDATAADVRTALADAELVTVAGHGASDRYPHRNHLMVRDGQVTAGDIVALDLSGLQFVLLAACEAASIDRSAPEHPLNVQTAALFAGAQASCGPLWRVHDSVASTFTRAMLRLVAQGASIGAAFLGATQETDGVRPGARYFSLCVDDDSGLMDVPVAQAQRTRNQ